MTGAGDSKKARDVKINEFAFLEYDHRKSGLPSEKDGFIRWLPPSDGCVSDSIGRIVITASSAFKARYDSLLRCYRFLSVIYRNHAFPGLYDMPEQNCQHFHGSWHEDCMFIVEAFLAQ